MPWSPFPPPNRTALLLPMEVREKPAHGGGLSPVMSGEIHTSVVWKVVICYLKVTIFVGTNHCGLAQEHKTLYMQTKGVVFLRLP